MKTVNIHEAKTHLSRLVEAASKGQGFVIARAGKPLVQVSGVSVPAPRRIGFLKGRIDVPEDFDRMGADEIAAAFDGRA
ncbi:type II toxin-antitoxin system Phd/YefM family antitoxin [Roseivivax sp. CAU 1761]